MSDQSGQFSVTDLDRRARQTLNGWLGDAENDGIDLDDAGTIQDAYERYVEAVLAQAPDEREDPTPVLTMIGMALGEHLQRNSDLVWRIVTDAQGSDLGLAIEDGSGAFFPVDPVAANWAEQNRQWLVPFVAELLGQLHQQGDRP